ncbi:MAG: tetratricopeptide repeat protein [Phycisphaerales bacterium JB047]
MSGPEHFDLVCSIFEQIRQLDIDQQQKRLRELCSGDHDLQSEVQSMLSMHQAPSPLDQPSHMPCIDTLVTMDRCNSTPDIERYEIGDRIGEGGMGEVYAAEMLNPRRSVAIKVIRMGMSSERVLERFDLERQAIARMEHPNIASVLDAGVTSDGRPYIAMELVRGLTIIQQLQTSKLDTRARIELLIQVCHAIQHAHQRGIIHRDIKPSNIIVTQSDGKMIPKVIDFGIAKATRENGEIDATMTAHARAIGTPAYMSPEQADPSIGDVDTRTDVYSLGVVLYEVLTGSTPLIKSELTRKSYAELIECIREQDPPRPSTRLAMTRLDQDQQMPVLPEQLRGDLDWIVMKCLEKDPNRRYGTVSALAQDLARHLNDEPVLARPASRSYITRKFIRRHRGSVIASGIVLCVLLLGMTGTSFGFVWAMSEQEHAKMSERVAQQEARVAEQTVEFLLTDLLGAADPARMEDRDLTVREAVRIASDSVQGKFADEPLLEARIRTTIARTLNQLGAFQEAEPHHRRNLDIYRSIQGDGGTDTINTMHALASNLIYQSRYDEAIDLTLEELEIFRGQSDPDTVRLTNALSTLGEVYLQTGQYDQAAPILEESLQANRELLGDLDPKTLASMHNLAGLYGSIGNKERALQLAMQAYEGRLEVLGPGDPKTFGSLNVVTWVLNILERNDESIAILQEAIAQANERLGETHLQTVALTRSLANLYYNQGEFALAEQTLAPMVDILRSSLGEENLNTFTTMRTLGVYIALQGREEDALPLFSQALELARGKYPPDSFDLTVFMESYGASLTRSGHFAQAEAVFLEAMEILKDAGPSGEKFSQNITESMTRMYTDWNAHEPDAAREAKLMD